jgi:glycosyltransferase involved in cell wall biosynthesis
MHILHIITSTDPGGAETTLFHFVSQSQSDLFSHQVISLAALGAVGEKIAQIGVPTSSMNFSNRMGDFLSFPRLVTAIRRSSTDLIHCWMYHANLLGGLAAGITGIPSLWHIHHYDLNPALLKKSTILVARLGARFSNRLPQRIIYCANSAQSEHQRAGYDSTKGVFIPNGFDTLKFSPDRESGMRARSRFSIPPDADIVGHVGRFHPTKDHLTLLRAARIVREELPDTFFVLCGSRVEESNQQLEDWIEELDLHDNIRLISQQEEMTSIYNMMDILVSSSLSEAFPVVIGEAMSCGIPCAVTDAGDSALLIGDTGLATPTADADALAESILRLLRDKDLRRSKGESARKRIQNHFSISAMAASIEALYMEILA